jgi:hypothetical protein
LGAISSLGKGKESGGSYVVLSKGTSRQYWSRRVEYGGGKAFMGGTGGYQMCVRELWLLEVGALLM